MEKADKKLANKRFLLMVKRLMYGLCSALAVLVFSTFQAKALYLIYDEESELFLQKIAQPIFKAAKVPYNRNKI